MLVTGNKNSSSHYLPNIQDNITLVKKTIRKITADVLKLKYLINQIKVLTSVTYLGVMGKK